MQLENGVCFFDDILAWSFFAGPLGLLFFIMVIFIFRTLKYSNMYPAESSTDEDPTKDPKIARRRSRAPWTFTYTTIMLVAWVRGLRSGGMH
jgi:hypothetical protein